MKGKIQRKEKLQWSEEKKKNKEKNKKEKKPTFAFMVELRNQRKGKERGRHPVITFFNFYIKILG